VEDIFDFKDKELGENAFVHRSYLNEHPSFKLGSNERLEFLGDAVLEFLTSDFLYKKYPQAEEGILTAYRSALVKTETLAERAKKLDFGSRLKLSRGEDDSGGRSSEYILANTFEAYLGALYLDQGIKKCSEFLEEVLFPQIEGIIQSGAYKDYKSLFQEIAQEKIGLTPTYEVVDEWGPDHDKVFKVAVSVGGEQKGIGEGSSKQKAEVAAAKDALQRLGWA
jgi:ribonuclease III